MRLYSDGLDRTLTSVILILSHAEMLRLRNAAAELVENPDFGMVKLLGEDAPPVARKEIVLIALDSEDARSAGSRIRQVIDTDT